MPRVTRLCVTPVKGLALQEPAEVLLERHGVAENRRFYLIDAADRLFAGTRHGPLVRVHADYDPERERLTMRFPDGAVVDGDLGLGASVETDFYGRPVGGRIVEGPWAAALSAYTGKRLRLIRADRPGDACDVHVATLVSDASVAELSRRGGRDESVDARRFRMLITVDGSDPHEEDTWAGRRVRVGEAVVQVLGPVPRCVVTTHDPATGIPDFETLRTIGTYRGLRDGKRLDFGVYADVEREGPVRIGDPVEPE